MKDDWKNQQRILITGITGTAGTAFTDHLRYNGHSIVGIDRNEEGVARFRREYPDIPVYPMQFGDWQFGMYGEGVQFDLVIHLAAMKHVDLCEKNPEAAIKNNLTDSIKLFREATRHGANILFMSTDKAVEPVSVYGYSKFLAERVALAHDGSIIRSGNILGSSGSVVHIWREAIAENRPIILTDPAMKRFFITPKHLASRAWDMYRDGTKVIVPEMDKEVLMSELLDEILFEHGYTQDDYPGGIDVVGPRPGEKMEEVLHGK